MQPVPQLGAEHQVPVQAAPGVIATFIVRSPNAGDLVAPAFARSLGAVVEAYTLMGAYRRAQGSGEILAPVIETTADYVVLLDRLATSHDPNPRTRQLWRVMDLEFEALPPLINKLNEIYFGDEGKARALAQLAEPYKARAMAMTAALVMQSGATGGSGASGSTSPNSSRAATPSQTPGPSPSPG